MPNTNTNSISNMQSSSLNSALALNGRILIEAATVTVWKWISVNVMYNYINMKSDDNYIKYFNYRIY